MATVVPPPAVRDVPENETPQSPAAATPAAPPPKPDWSQQEEIAEYLDWLTRGQLDVVFAPADYFNQDRFHPQCPSRGHLYDVSLNCGCSEDWFSYWLDDREEKPLEEQLIEVVRCMAKRFKKIINTIEQRRAHIKAGELAGKAGAA
ncbi:MAG: hypothetical protein KF708_22450 [Pirellulales bacterium]|nr:hypothetical protein [Pirellulales bacterium]